MRLIAVMICVLFTVSVWVQDVSDSDSRYGPWWRDVPKEKISAMIKFCTSYLDLTAQEQSKVFYFNEDHALETWKVCSWLYVKGHLEP